MDVAGQAARDRDAVGFLAVILGDLERWRDTAAADAQQAGTEAGREFARGEAHGFRTAAGLVAAGLARAQGPRGPVQLVSPSDDLRPFALDVSDPGSGTVDVQLGNGRFVPWPAARCAELARLIDRDDPRAWDLAPQAADWPEPSRRALAAQLWRAAVAALLPAGSDDDDDQGDDLDRATP